MVVYFSTATNRRLRAVSWSIVALPFIPGREFKHLRLVTQVPAGSIITVLNDSHPEDIRMVDVYWHVHKLVMFADDIEKRGEQVADASS